MPKILDIEHWRAERDHYAPQLGLDPMPHSFAGPAATASYYHRAAQAILYYEQHGELPRWAQTSD